MVLTRVFAFALAAVAALAPSAQATSCPPQGFDAKQAFNPAKFFDGRWFPLKQLPVAYQPEDQLFCVSADYKIEKTNLCQLRGCDDIVVRVFNAANTGGVNGPRNSAQLNGVIKDPASPSKASVGPSFLPDLFYGPYWVVEAGTYDDLLAGKQVFEGEKYEWAIISVGAPTVERPNGCLPGTGSALDPRGLWLFSRKAIVPEVNLKALEALAAAKGFDVSALKTVTHEGCTY